MKKNLLLIVPNLKLGGQQRVAINTAAILEAEYNITLVVFTLEDAVYHSECQTIDLGIPAEDGVFHKIRNAFRRKRSLLRLKQELKIDISMSFGDTANLANILSRKSEKTILTIHGYASLSGSYFKKILDRYIYRRAHKVACVSAKMTTDLMALFHLSEDKVVTLHNPYDFDSIAEQALAAIADEIKHPAIITMGRLEKIKGYRHLLRVFRIVQQNLPEAVLYFAGDGEERKELEMLAKELGLAQQVVFLGFQSNPFRYIAKCDLFVLSSIHEGFPNALVESMACAIPVVASDCKSGPREIISSIYSDTTATEVEYADYGILIPPFAADESSEPELDQLFADAILRILKGGEIYKHYRQKSVERAKAFSFDVYKHKVMDIIEK